MSAGPINAPATILITDSSHSPYAAGRLIRLGYLRAFGCLGFRAEIVNTYRLEKALRHTENPHLFLSQYDFSIISKKLRRLIRDIPRGVWVLPEDEAFRRAYEPFGIKIKGSSRISQQKLLEVGATFYWANVPSNYIDIGYELWCREGRMISLPLACDNQCYYPDPGDGRYANIELVYCGGFWEKKNYQYKQYLRPYEEELTVFGRNKWPYKGYRGPLSINDERNIYYHAKISPTLSEPHALALGDITERVFKILGSSGLAVTDAIPAYKELFSDEELLVPETVEQYHDMIHTVRNNFELSQHHRKAGYRAILSRHLYIHRAVAVLREFGFNIPAEKYNELISEHNQRWPDSK